MIPMQSHILSFEGPDRYSRAGGLATRVDGLSQALADLGHQVHLWFVGDPEAPYEERRGRLHLHRWCQGISRRRAGGVYDGEDQKEADYASALPGRLFDRVLRPHLERGGRAIVLGEEWQTGRAVLQLHGLLQASGLRERVTTLWNANNTFGFQEIAWQELSEASGITTVSRYMKHRMREVGVSAFVIPNGLPEDAFDPANRSALSALRSRYRDRMLVVKMARWDPDKAWLTAIETVAVLKRIGWRPLLVARGGGGAYGEVVLEAARHRNLRVVDRTARPGADGLLEALQTVDEADVVNLQSYVDPESRKVLLRGSDAVLANSSHEPFGLVGLETMAAGGVACTGCSGEDYAIPGQNALVLQTADPREFVGLYEGLRQRPGDLRSLRRAGQATARCYAWRAVVKRVLLPRVAVLASVSGQRSLDGADWGSCGATSQGCGLSTTGW